MPVKTSKAQEIGLEIEKLNSEVREVHDLVDEKQDGVPTDEQKEKVIANNKRIAELEKEFQKTEEWRKSRELADQRGESLDIAAGRGISSEVLKAMNMTMRDAQKGLGDQVIDSEIFKEFVKAVCPGGSASPMQFGSSPAIQVKTLVTGASSTSAGAFIIDDRKPIVDPGTFYRPLTLLDIVGRGTTDSDTVTYVREGTHTNSADGVSEATATSGGSGAAPESAMVLAIVSESVKNIAHFVPATRISLADAKQMRSLIDQFLRYGVAVKLEDQMYGGTGGEDLTGIVETTGTTTQAWDTDILTTTRKARTKVRTTGRGRPTHYVLHPTDWETLDLTQDNEAGYYFGGPSAIGVARLWGLPVVECEAATAGAGVCGDFNLSMLWDREQTAIYVSDSHQDFFTRGLVAIMAVMRGAFGLIRPAAFVEMDLTA